MYIPTAFASTNTTEILDFVASHPLAALVTATAGAGLYATHLPLIMEAAEPPGSLFLGHMARANPHWRALAGEGCDALAIFTGPNAYITPGWYATKVEHGRVVPTWNYEAAHAYGRLRVCADQSLLRRHLEALTAKHEATQPSPWEVGDAPASFVDSQIPAIVAVEFTVARWEGKWKMSQNRSAADIQGVIRGLANEAGAEAKAVSDLVAERCPVSKRAESQQR